MPDQLGGGRTVRRLGVFEVPGQCLNDFGVKRCALGRDQRRTFLAAKIIVHHHAMVSIRDDQVDARLLVVSGKQQMRIWNDDGIRKTMMWD